jgi:transposase
VQEQLLNEVLAMITAGTQILLAGDRFYGTHALVSWCQQHGWKYRIRLKGNIRFICNGKEMSGDDAVSRRMASMVGARFKNSDCITNIGILWKDGHKEPWIIAMDSEPSKNSTLEYGKRWSIECMFSDFKSRGFGITKTHLKHADRIERLILVLTVALYWVVARSQKLHFSITRNNNEPKII